MIDPIAMRRRVESVNESIGSAVINRAVTAKLHVSKNGDNSDGSTWAKAYNKIQDALDAASTDINECTLILIAIATGPTDFYDIDTSGDPTWTGNYILQGTHRTWAKIKNTDGSADSIMKFTGYISLNDLNFNLGAADCNGVIITKSAFRLNHLQFVGEDIIGAATALEIDGATGGTTLKHGKLIDVNILGESEFVTGLKLDKVARSNFQDLTIHNCVKGIHIDNATSDHNRFCHIGIGDCDHANGIAIDIDAGSEQYFDGVFFHHNTLNIDDAVHDHHWNNIGGEFPITTYPEDVDGIAVEANALADIFGTDTELRGAGIATKPFKVVGYFFKPAVTQEHLIRFSADSEASWFNQVVVGSTRGRATAANAATDFVFNVGQRISASIMAESAGSDIVYIWLKLQII